MITGLIIILLLTLLLPFAVKQVEHNLEFFLLLMGLGAAAFSGILNMQVVIHILENSFLYMITFAVLAIGFLFRCFREKIRLYIAHLLEKINLKLFIFLLIVVLGLLSSLITAIIASLILVEVILLLPLSRSRKISITVTACFSIGLGAALTPLGEPIATIVVSKLGADFGFMLREIGLLVLPGIFALGVLGTFFVKREEAEAVDEPGEAEETLEKDEESYIDIAVRALKVFVFVAALELLGAGFKPLIDTYVLGLDSRLLYWGNTISAVLDNATLAAAELSPKMDSFQIRAILIGLLVSGGMLIPGNIPNIIAAGKLRIDSKEWVKLGVPLGLVMLLIYFVVLFVI